jgi:hypothetical protein
MKRISAGITLKKTEKYGKLCRNKTKELWTAAKYIFTKQLYHDTIYVILQYMVYGWYYTCRSMGVCLGGLNMRREAVREMFACVPEVDFNSGYKYFLQNMENYSKALMSILKSIKSKLPILELMVYSEEYEGLRTITQTLRKMLSNIGAGGLAETSYWLEAALLNDDKTDIREQLSSYIVGLSMLSDNLEVLLKKMDVKSVVKKDEDNSGSMRYDFTKTKESIRLSSDLLERKIM